MDEASSEVVFKEESAETVVKTSHVITTSESRHVERTHETSVHLENIGTGGESSGGTHLTQMMVISSGGASGKEAELRAEGAKTVCAEEKVSVEERIEATPQEAVEILEGPPHTEETTAKPEVLPGVSEEPQTVEVPPEQKPGEETQPSMQPVMEEAKPALPAEVSEPVGEKPPVVQKEPEKQEPHNISHAEGTHELPAPGTRAPVEIPQENIKSQLREIISEIEVEVNPEYEGEEGDPQHTWKPKGSYPLQKTEIQFKEVVPVEVPEVRFSETPTPKEKTPKDKTPQMQQVFMEAKKPEEPIFIQPVSNGEIASPIEIPEGIPLLARVLPKEEGETGREKISLERLFTPATDSGEITPRRRKVYASSAFYRPDHPTIEDQVELAQKISCSLVDDNNKQSRGQSMYIKRKNRSAKWIHQGGAGEEDLEGEFGDTEEDTTSPQHKERPPLKLLMSPKGIQDNISAQQQYQQIMTSSQISSEMSSKEITPEMPSPTGKGAALFAKRKKRMDKFIVDETTIQQSSSYHQQQQQTMMTQEMTSQSHGTIMQMGATGIIPPPPMPGAVAAGGPAMYTAEVKVVKGGSMSPTGPGFDLAATPHHSLLDLATKAEKAEKRKSFNLAAKGWGTYNQFYTPVTFGAS